MLQTWFAIQGVEESIQQTFRGDSVQIYGGHIFMSSGTLS